MLWNLICERWFHSLEYWECENSQCIASLRLWDPLSSDGYHGYQQQTHDAGDVSLLLFFRVLLSHLVNALNKVAVGAEIPSVQSATKWSGQALKKKETFSQSASMTLFSAWIAQKQFKKMFGFMKLESPALSLLNGQEGETTAAAFCESCVTASSCWGCCSPVCQALPCPLSCCRLLNTVSNHMRDGAVGVNWHFSHWESWLTFLFSQLLLLVNVFSFFLLF